MSYELDLFIKDRTEWYTGLNDLNNEFNSFKDSEQDAQRRRIGSDIERSVLIPARQIIDMTQQIEKHLMMLDELDNAIEELRRQEGEDTPKQKVKTR